MSTPTGSAAPSASRPEPTAGGPAPKGGSQPARRTMLRGAAAVGAVAAGASVVAACSTTGGSNGAKGDSGRGAGANGPTTVGKAADVPVGRGAVFGDTNVVVTQPAAGDYHAFDATCPHMGCQVKKIDQGVITCPCHGSQFAISDGTVVRGPATKGLKQLPVTVKDGTVVVG